MEGIIALWRNKLEFSETTVSPSRDKLGRSTSKERVMRTSLRQCNLKHYEVAVAKNRIYG